MRKPLLKEPILYYNNNYYSFRLGNKEVFHGQDQSKITYL